MNGLDIVLLIVVLISGLNGFRQGFIQAFANLVGWLVAFFVAIKYATSLAPMLTMFNDPVVQKVSAFALMVVAVMMVTWFLSGVLQRILNRLKLGPLNRLAGAAFGTVKAVLVILILLKKK